MTELALPPYETILVEQRGRVGLITLNRPKALNALNVQLAKDVTDALRDFRRQRRHRLHRHRRIGKGFRRRRRHQGNAEPVLSGHPSARLVSPVGPVAENPQADHRRRFRLRARRRLRTGDDVRFHHRLRDRQIRPAGNQARRHAGDWRLAAPDPRRGQGQGDGHVPDRPA